MVCGQVPILASCCLQFLSNPLPLLVNGHIIFRFLFILWMALRLRFSTSITREQEVTGKAWAGKLCTFFPICLSYQLSNILLSE